MATVAATLGHYGPRTSPLALHPLTIEVQGLDDGTQQPIDFYQPAVRGFRQKGLSAPNRIINSLRRPLVIEPVDTVLVWKGLTLSDCETLILVQDHVKACLEQLLEDQFIDFKTRLRSDSQSSLQDSLAMPEVVETVIPCQFYFVRTQLTQAVSKALEKTTSRRTSNGGRPFKELLGLYLWSRDCLFDLPNASGYTALNAQFRCHMDAGACCPSSSVIEALCTPDHLSFEGLDVLPQEGTQIVIKPHYQANAPRRPGCPFTLVTYTLESNHPWLHWNDEAVAFQGQVPRFSQYPNGNSALGQFHRLGPRSSHAAVHNVTIEVKAFIVISYFGSGICLERTIRPAVRSQSHVSSLLQSQHLHDEGERLRPEDCVNTDPRQASVQSQEEHVAGLTPLLSAPVGASILGSSPRKTSCSPPNASTKAQDSKRCPVNLETGFEFHSNGQSLPSWGKKQESAPRLIMSNIPGVKLDELALIQSNPDDPVLKEHTRCIFHDNKGRPEESVTSNERYLEQAEAFDDRYTTRTLKKRNAEPRSFDATRSPRGSRLKSQEASTSSPHAQRSLQNAKSFSTVKTPPPTQGFKSDASHFVMRSAGRRKIRSSQHFRSSIKGSQDHSFKVSSLGEETVFVPDLREEESRHNQTQRGTVAPKTVSFAASLTAAPRSDRTASNSTTTSDTPQTVVFFNRYAALQGLPSGSDRGLSSICGTSNSGDFELPLHAAAPNSEEQIGRLGATDPSNFSAFCFRDNGCDHTQKHAFLSQEDGEASSSEEEPSTMRSDPRDKASVVRLSPDWTGTKTMMMGASMTTTAQMSRSSSPYTDGLPSGPSSEISLSPTCSEAPFSIRSGWEQRAAWRVSTNKEAVEACRERGLSNDERFQMFEALKRSLTPEPATEDIAAYSMASASEVDFGTDMEAESATGSAFDSGVGWVGDCEKI
ncbi:MAG: hypothetical protein LQ344_005011 [Seirophora lacunosa]|nr:MAG: hypothetical protein LQ344_005011 [Seirophora lacunosa]